MLVGFRYSLKLSRVGHGTGHSRERGIDAVIRIRSVSPADEIVVVKFLPFLGRSRAVVRGNITARVLLCLDHVSVTVDELDDVFEVISHLPLKQANVRIIGLTSCNSKDATYNP